MPSIEINVGFKYQMVIFFKSNSKRSLTLNILNSVRVSNELGSGNAWAAKFSVIVVSITSVAIGVNASMIVFATRAYFPYLYTTSDAVAKETTNLAILLGITVLLNSLQPVLCGMLPA